MKQVKIIEEGVLLNVFNANLLKRELLYNVRNSLRCLVRIGVLKHKERNDIEYYIDKIIYLTNKKKK